MSELETKNSVATLKYKDKLIGATNATYLSPKNFKYTITFNKDKTQAKHFFNSKDLFFEWETPNDGNHGVDLEITDQDGNWTEKAVFIPTEIKTAWTKNNNA